METGMLNVQWVPIGTLKLNPRNARTHQNKQVKQMADSINAFGWTAPIVLDENSMILAGHGPILLPQGWAKRTLQSSSRSGFPIHRKEPLLLPTTK
jgi:hypothetical protein